jgi:DNA-directed RNA polymerase specialized sigma24 family protein
MGIAKSLTPHLPFLRRYARALTGSQTSGDAYVRAALEALLAGEHELLEGASPRVALFRLFHVIWSTSGAPDEAGPRSSNASAEERLQSLTPDSREALLLTAVEGFSLSETATILSKSEAGVERDIIEAQRAIEEQLASRVLIIEDESIIALDLENLVVDLGHQVVGIAATRDDAIRQARAQQPGLVLADIRLADGSSGIDAVSEILRSFDIPVIFITAYPERLLTGERPEPTYLITKPFLPETVKATVAQALFFHPAKQKAA